MNMKRVIYSLLVCFTLFFVSSCEDTTEDVSKVTHFASLELKGDLAMKMKLNESYVEPGFTATEGSEDISSKVKITGTVNSAKTGVYTLGYSVANVDGFAVSKNRLVLVSAPTFASAYFGESSMGTRHYYNAPINIQDKGDGTFLLDDIAGGFYFNGRYPGYEPTYDFHGEAVIKLEADNSITLVSIGSWYWDSTSVTLTKGSYSPETGKVSLELSFGGSAMYVTLTK